MDKKLTAALVAIFIAGSVFAYNPPAGGQNLLRLSSADLLTGGASAAGSPFFNGGVSSIVNNPALTAYEQRITLDLAGTLMFDSADESESTLGGAFHAGLLIPSRWYVYSFLLQGVFVPFYDMHLGNSFNLTANISKDITDNLSVGLGVTGGIFYGYNTDWAGAVNLGAFYRLGDISFMRDVRFGASLMNLGKPFNNTDVIGIESTPARSWPGIATFKIGSAAVLFDSKQFDIGASLDMSFPTFMNFVFDAALKISVLDIISVSAAWEFDVREFAAGERNLMPSVGIGFKFIFSSKDGSLLAEKGWAQSEIAVSGAWKQLYENVNAVSLNGTINLGLEDEQPPEIILWNAN